MAMEIKEQDCLKLSKSFSTFSTEVSSSDNDLAVITRNGVHVLVSYAKNLALKSPNFRFFTDSNTFLKLLEHHTESNELGRTVSFPTIVD